MHIKKLEICGFKSFIDRTVIHFDHDVIGIVGPNGCGKSNVVDAIRWVMGEQSPKALRGKCMADVIFNGSETRPAAGFSEVTITFDNSDAAMAQQLPLEYRDYAELAVTRRAYRGDGSNDYFINKTPVRLRDVTDVFLGTGVGRKAYSIVEQGKIGLIVSARPEDRRMLIEEAAGITKYKARKRQAENKMSATRQNLARVGDIVAEIERQLASLKRQAAKAARYQRYRGELDDLWLWDASHRLLELIVTTEVAASACTELATQAEQQRTSVNTRDAEIEVLRQQAHAVEQEAEQAQNSAFMSDNEVREQEGRIDRGSDRYRALSLRLGEALDEQRGLQAKAETLEGEVIELTTALSGVDTEQQRAQRCAEQEADKLAAMQTEAGLAAARLQQLREAEATRAAAIARSEEAVVGCEQRMGDARQRIGRIGDEHGRLATETQHLSDRRRALAAQVDELVTRKHAMCDARDALGVELPLLQSRLEVRTGDLERCRLQLGEKQNRLRALQELSKRMEGVGAGVKSLLETGDTVLSGLVADRLDVPPSFTAAVAGLVGDRLQCVIVDDLDRGLELLRALADEQQGRATVVPRQATCVTQAAPTVSGDGVLGLLIDKLHFADEDGPLLRALFSGAVLVDHASTAQRLRRQHPGSDLVTLDGMVFHHDGRVTGGAGDTLAATMLEHKREIAELTLAVAPLGEQAVQATEEVAELRSKYGKLQQALDEAKSEAHEAVLTMVTGEQDLQRLDQRLELVGSRQREVAEELRTEEQTLEAARQEHTAIQAGLAERQQAVEQARASLEAAEQRSAASREQLDEQQANYTEHKVRLASINERAAAGQLALDRVARERAEVGHRIALLEQDRTRCAIDAGQTAAAIVLARSEALSAKGRARKAHSHFETARQQLDEARHALALREAELREMRAMLDEVTTQLQQQQMELQRLRLERQHLDEAVRERFRGLELARVVGDYHARPPIAQGQRERISELGGLIDRMGAVNLDAMAEYQQAGERYQFLTGQREDLDRALADLERAIAQMNRESRRLFKHAFEGINRRFIEIFPKMFRGGKAELRLTDPSDLLETGIDILAQPPGKRVGHIELMSGGEKAFTAVSLLLAIFRYKPSPFCILDEVDAPLDEANIGRYVEAVRAMTDRSQFIVITHSRRTMEAVDVLYGVTMQEPGVSKLVGVRVRNGPARSETTQSTGASAQPADELLHAAAGSEAQGDPSAAVA